MPDQGLAAELLPPAVVAKRLGVSAQTIRNHVRSGRLRGYRVGRQLRVDVSTLDGFVRSGDDQLDALAAEIAEAAPELSEASRDRIAALLRIARPFGQKIPPLGA